MREPTRSNTTKKPILFADDLHSSLIKNALLSFASAATIILVAYTIAHHVPKIVYGDFSHVNNFAITLTIVGIVRAAISYLSERSNTASYLSLTETLRNKIILRLFNSDRNHYHYSTVLTSGLKSLEPYVRQYVPALVEAAVIPPIVLLCICAVDITSCLIILVTVPLVPLFMILIGKQTHDISSRQWKGLQELTNQFSTFLEGIPTIRMLGKQERLVEHIDSISQKYRRILIRTLRFAFLSAFALEAIATLSIAIVAVALGTRLVSGDILLHKALFILFAVPECYWPLRRLGAAFHASETGKDAVIEINEILDTPISATETKQYDFSQPIYVGDMRFIDNDGVNRLDTEGFNIKPGHILGIVGPNGSGKSTLLNILRGSIDLSKNEISYTPKTVENCFESSFSEKASFISQNCLVYGDTVEEAITWTAHCINKSELDRVLEKLRLTDIRYSDPQELSGGQRQRVCIAQAVYMILTDKAEILIADEPTSHLDDVSTENVLELFQELSREKKYLLIASHDTRIFHIFNETVPLTKPHLQHDQHLYDSTKHTNEFKRNPLHLATELDPTESIHVGASFFNQISKTIWKKSLKAVAVASMADISTIALTGVSLWLIVRASQRPIFSELALAALFVRVCGIGKALFRYIERLTTHEAALDLVSQLRKVTVRALIHLAPAGFPEMRRGDLLERVTDDHERAQDLFIRSVLPSTSSLLTGILVSIAVIFVQPQAGMIIFCLVIVSGVAIPTISFLLERKRSLGNDRASSNYFREISNVVESIDILRSNAGRTFSIAKINHASTALSSQLKNRSKTSGVLKSMLGLTPILATGTVALLIPYFDRNLSPPIIGLTLLISLSLLATYENNYKFGETFIDGTQSWGRIHEIISRDPVIIDTKKPIPITDISVELVNASFRWNHTIPASENVSFILSNEHPFVLVQGPSGSGKSTLAAGLVRFLDVYKGTYCFDNVDVNKRNQNETRRHITWCPQSPWLLPGTIRDNLRLGSPRATDKQMHEALQKVSGDQFVLNYENGLDQDIGINGEYLSIGEKNKIALARTLLTDITIKILDEPTASLDKSSSAILLTNIRANQNGDMLVLITHEDLESYDDEHVTGHIMMKPNG